MKCQQNPQISANPNQKIYSVIVIITALGYFVDMFDMFLFNMLRITSLTDLGISGKSLTQAGLWISNAQFAGFLMGAWIAGLLADRYGRKKMLYAAIFLYSIGSFLSAACPNVLFYALARFVSGLGLAGELGIGITLIAEGLASRHRGFGALIFAGMGLIGVITAALMAQLIPWRLAYIIGGLLGFALLAPRMLLPESKIYAKQNAYVRKGGLIPILQSLIF